MDYFLEGFAGADSIRRVAGCRCRSGGAWCFGGSYLTAAMTFTRSCDEIRLTYPTAPGVAETYSIRADSESNTLGMAPCPVKTNLRHSERNSSGLSPTWLFKKTSCTGPPFKVTGTAWAPSANLVLVPMKMARKSAFVISEICTPLFATSTTSCALAADHEPREAKSRIKKRVLLMLRLSWCYVPKRLTRVRR